MEIFDWVLSILTLVSAVFLMFWRLRSDRNLFNGQETSLRKYFTASALQGLCVFLLYIGIFLVGVAMYPDYGFTTRETILIVVLGLIVGILAMIASLWQFFIVTKFRESLYQSLSRRIKKK